MPPESVPGHIPNTNSVGFS